MFFNKKLNLLALLVISMVYSTGIRSDITWGDGSCSVFGQSPSRYKNDDGDPYPVHPMLGHMPGSGDDRWSEWADACKYACQDSGYKKKSNAHAYKNKFGWTAVCCCE